MAQRNVVALSRITTSRAGSQLEFTGKYDAQGSPVLRKKQFSIMAGEVFRLEESDPDFVLFLEGGFIRLATAEETDASRADTEKCALQAT